MPLYRCRIACAAGGPGAPHRSTTSRGIPGRAGRRARRGRRTARPGAGGRASGCMSLGVRLGSECVPRSRERRGAAGRRRPGIDRLAPLALGRVVAPSAAGGLAGRARRVGRPPPLSPPLPPVPRILCVWVMPISAGRKAKMSEAELRPLQLEHHLQRTRGSPPPSQPDRTPEFVPPRSRPWALAPYRTRPGPADRRRRSSRASGLPRFEPARPFRQRRA